MQLTEHDILLTDEVLDKHQALTLIARQLSDSGLTTPDYELALWAREQQISTYLGNGIAIPHGTTEQQESVLNTGVKVVWFKHGVDWGEGNTAYVALGIAARTTEHLDILRQLTRVLSDDGVLLRIQSVTTAQELLAVLSPAEDALDCSDSVVPLQGHEAVFMIANTHGLHARPGAVLVKQVKQFNSEITVTNLDAPSSVVNAKNLMKVIGLGVKKGHRLKFCAQGDDAEQALVALGCIIADGLGEDLAQSTPKRSWLNRLFN